MVDCFYTGLHKDGKEHEADCLWVAAPSGNELALCPECRVEWLIDAGEGSCPMPFAILALPEDWEWGEDWKMVLWNRSQQQSSA